MEPRTTYRVIVAPPLFGAVQDRSTDVALGLAAIRAVGAPGAPAVVVTAADVGDHAPQPTELTAMTSKT